MNLVKISVEPDNENGFELFSDNPLEVDLIVGVCLKNHFEDIRICPASYDEVNSWIDNNN